MDAFAILDEMAEEITFHQAGTVWTCEAKVQGHRVMGRGTSLFSAAAQAVCQTHVWGGPCTCTTFHKSPPAGAQLRVVYQRSRS